MFNLAQVIGNGLPQTLVSTDSIIEGNLHSTVIFNPSGSVVDVTIAVGGVVLAFKAAAATHTSVPMSINVPANTIVNVTAPVGVTVSASYVTMPIDTTGALTVVQQLVQEVESYVATLPEGTLNDSIISNSTTYSSEKIAFELSLLAAEVGTGQTLAQTQATALYF